MKKCCKCKIDKDLSKFGVLRASPDGYRYDCNDCRKLYRESNKAKIKEAQHKYYVEHKDELLKKSKIYNDNHRAEICEQRKSYRERPEIKEHIKNKQKEYLPIRCEKIKERRLNDDCFRLSEIMRSKVHKMVKNSDTSYKTLIGCDHVWFKKWISFNFDEHMNWNNLGSYWEIDHVLPITLFNHNNLWESKICYHWTNLQPLHKTENKKKSNKLMLHYYFNNLVSVARFNKTHKEFLGYQALNESLMWLRTKNSGMVTMPHMKRNTNFSEIDNPHPSTSASIDNGVVKVQRLNGIGSEEYYQL